MLGVFMQFFFVLATLFFVSNAKADTGWEKFLAIAPLEVRSDGSVQTFAKKSPDAEKIRKEYLRDPVAITKYIAKYWNTAYELPGTDFMGNSIKIKVPLGKYVKNALFPALHPAFILGAANPLLIPKVLNDRLESRPKGDAGTSWYSMCFNSTTFKVDSNGGIPLSYIPERTFFVSDGMGDTTGANAVEVSKFKAYAKSGT
jgi:hypothetical protein